MLVWIQMRPNIFFGPNLGSNCLQGCQQMRLTGKELGVFIPADPRIGTGHYVMLKGGLMNER